MSLTGRSHACMHRRSSRRRWQSKSPGGEGREVGGREPGSTSGSRNGQRRPSSLRVAAGSGSASNLRRYSVGDAPGATASSCNASSYHDQAGHAFPHLVLVGGQGATAAPADFATL